jgi:hypothetical protein
MMHDDDLMWRTVPSDAFQADVTASILFEDEGAAAAVA